MVPVNKSHVLAALLLVAAAACIGHDAVGAIIPAKVSTAMALVFGVVPCSTGSLINAVTAPPFASKYI